MNEYAVFDIIFKSQTSIKYSEDGWSNLPYSFIADNLGLKKGGVFAIVERGVKWGLIEINEANTNLKKATELWETSAYLVNLDGVELENFRERSKNERSKNERKPVQKMNGIVQKSNAKYIKGIKFNNKTLSKEENQKFESDDEAIPTILDDLKKEKNCAKKEKNDYSYLPPEEQEIMSALDRTMEFFEEWPAMEQKFKEDARITDPAFDLRTEALRWLRMNANNPGLLKTPEKHIHRSLAKILMKYNQFNSQQSKGKNNARSTNHKSNRPFHLITPDAATRILAKFAAEDCAAGDGTG